MRASRCLTVLSQRMKKENIIEFRLVLNEKDNHGLKQQSQEPMWIAGILKCSKRVSLGRAGYSLILSPEPMTLCALLEKHFELIMLV